MSNNASNKKTDPAAETEDPIVHGAGTSKPDHPQHADKVAPAPEVEKGEAIPGLGASGAGDSATASHGPEPGQGTKQ